MGAFTATAKPASALDNLFPDQAAAPAPAEEPTPTLEKLFGPDTASAEPTLSAAQVFGDQPNAPAEKETEQNP